MRYNGTSVVGKRGGEMVAKGAFKIPSTDIASPGKLGRKQVQAAADRAVYAEQQKRSLKAVKLSGKPASQDRTTLGDVVGKAFSRQSVAPRLARKKPAAGTNGRRFVTGDQNSGVIGKALSRDAKVGLGFGAATVAGTVGLANTERGKARRVLYRAQRDPALREELTQRVGALKAAEHFRQAGYTVKMNPAKYGVDKALDAAPATAGKAPKPTTKPVKAAVIPSPTTGGFTSALKPQQPMAPAAVGKAARIKLEPRVRATKDQKAAPGWPLAALLGNKEEALRLKKIRQLQETKGNVRVIGSRTDVFKRRFDPEDERRHRQGFQAGALASGGTLAAGYGVRGIARDTKALRNVPDYPAPGREPQMKTFEIISGKKVAIADLPEAHQQKLRDEHGRRSSRHSDNSLRHKTIADLKSKRGLVLRPRSGALLAGGIVAGAGAAGLQRRRHESRWD